MHVGVYIRKLCTYDICMYVCMYIRTLCIMYVCTLCMHIMYVMYACMYVILQTHRYVVLCFTTLCHNETILNP